MIYRNYSIVLFKDVSIEHYEEETKIKKKKKSFYFREAFRAASVTHGIF